MSHRSQRSLRGYLGRSRALAFALLAFAAFAVGACADEDVPGDISESSTVGASSEASSTGFPVTVRDSSGTDVRLERRPERIVSFSPGATEVLYAIGAGPQVVATDRFSDYPAETARTVKLEYSNPDPETALAQRPDLVIMATRQRTQVAQFRELGMTVFLAAEPTDLDGVYEHLRNLGALTGHATEAATVEANMKREIDAVIASVSALPSGPRVFYELSPDLNTVAPNTFVGSLLTALKARNVAEGASTQFPQLTAEAVLAADPEVIIVSDDAGETLESIAARPGWSGVSAVVNRRVYSVNSDIVNRPGPRLAQGIRAFGHALYPDRVPARP